MYPTEIPTTSLGTPGPVTESALLHAIAVLENDCYLVDLDDNGNPVLSEEEQKWADELASVVAMLKTEVARRERDQFKRAVWKDAAAKGWDKTNPAHRAHINQLIKENYPS